MHVCMQISYFALACVGQQCVGFDGHGRFAGIDPQRSKVTVHCMKAIAILQEGVTGGTDEL